MIKNRGAWKSLNGKGNVRSLNASEISVKYSSKPHPSVFLSTLRSLILPHFHCKGVLKESKVSNTVSEQVLPFQKSQTEAPLFQVKAYIHSQSTYLHFIDTNRNSTQATERKNSWKVSGWGREDVYWLFHLCSGHHNGTEMNWAQGRAGKV